LNITCILLKKQQHHDLELSLIVMSILSIPALWQTRKHYLDDLKTVEEICNTNFLYMDIKGHNF